MAAGIDRSRAAWSRRGAFALLVLLLAWLLLVQMPLFFGQRPMPRIADFTQYYVAARIGLLKGWAHIYDLRLQAALYNSVRPGPDPFNFRTVFVNPPLLAWVVAPLAVLPLAAAYWVWSGLGLAAFLAAWAGLVRGPRLTRAVHLVLGLGLFPFLIALQTGQVTIAIAASLALVWWLLDRGRDWQAGLVLAVALVKPQVALLLPPGLALAGRWKALMAWLAVGAALTVATMGSLGQAGSSQYMVALRSLSDHATLNGTWTLSALLGPGPLVMVLQAACAGLALWVAWRRRRLEIGPSLVALMVASLLVTGYRTNADFVILIVAAWIQLRSRPGRRHLILLLGIPAAAAMPHFGARPLLLFMLAWLASLLVSVRADREPLDGDPEPAPSRLAAPVRRPVMEPQSPLMRTPDPEPAR